MIETIEISKLEYFNLRLDSEKLLRLENGGVDNWDWYGESIYGEDTNEKDWDSFEEQLKDEIWENRKGDKSN